MIKNYNEKLLQRYVKKKNNNNILLLMMTLNEKKKKRTQYFKQLLSNYPHFKNSKCVLPMNNPIY